MAKMTEADVKQIQKTIKELQSQISEKTQQVTQLKKDLDDATRKQDAAEKKVERLEEQAKRLRAEAGAQKELEESEKQLKEAEQKITFLEGNLAQEQKKVESLETELKNARVATEQATTISAWVRQEGGMGLNRRDAPGTNSNVIDVIDIGTQVTLLEGPKPADGYNWWNIRTADNTEGWVAGEELILHPTG